MLDWILSATGAVLVLIVLRDVFQTLLHPRGRGVVSRQLMRATWRLFRRHRWLAALSGPAGMAATVIAWAAAVVLGWTLIYVAQMPDGFSYGSSLHPAGRNDLLDSLYLSLVSVSTLGFGDIVPTTASLRLAAPLEALVGFMLFTASVSWFLKIYGALQRRRVLALQLSTLRQARAEDSSSDIGCPPAEVITSLAGRTGEVVIDFIEHDPIYYFYDGDANWGLAATLGYAADLACEAQRDRTEQTRLAGAMLSANLQSLARVLDDRFLNRGGDMATVLQAYAEQHRPPT